MTRCPTCGTQIGAAEAQQACGTCHQIYHESCWRELGGCATYGCQEAPQVEKKVEVAPVAAGWGDSKACPVCTVEIQASALMCRCGARFPYADPMTRAEYQGWFEEERTKKRVRSSLVVMLILTLTGVLAPAVGVAAGAVAFSQRRRLSGAGGSFLAMGYGSALIGVTYLLVILLTSVGL